MKKLSLDPSALAVESFVTFLPGEGRGTVRGAGSCYTFSCPPGTCGIAPDSTVEKDGENAISYPRNCCV